ncbi:MAG: hypothetical protein J0H89_13335 [Rhizobiales bacterium]|nr:hypothetical protein [Hyphomicrobiales bacterium]
MTWDGTILNTGAEVTFPLYGWYFDGEQRDNGLPNTNIGQIDQLNGVIQHALQPPPPVNPGVCGNIYYMYCNTSN